MRLPKNPIVDTNVPILANSARTPDDIPDELVDCVDIAVKAIRHVMNNGKLVLDAGDEIFDEYRRKLSLGGQPGLGDAFLKWVHDNRWTFPEEDRVAIHPKGDTYAEFPDHPDLANFDHSDRKFVAVARAHPENPPILQAVDSKWWGWKDALQEAGVQVQFLCPDYVQSKWVEKVGA